MVAFHFMYTHTHRLQRLCSCVRKQMISLPLQMQVKRLSRIWWLKCLGDNSVAFVHLQEMEKFLSHTEKDLIMSRCTVKHLDVQQLIKLVLIKLSEWVNFFFLTPLSGYTRCSLSAKALCLKFCLLSFAPQLARLMQLTANETPKSSYIIKLLNFVFMVTILSNSSDDLYSNIFAYTKQNYIIVSITSSWPVLFSLQTLGGGAWGPNSTSLH